jgi:pyruvate dehydrogenase E2 component (dihydrolipoamide acetyltransferase)
MIEIVMPKLSDSMQEGTIIAWAKDTGEHVTAGEELLEIETDKSIAAYPAEHSGTLQILASVGSTVTVGTPIARLTALEDTASPPDPGTTTDATEDASANAAQAVTAPQPPATRRQPSFEPPRAHSQPGDGLKATPLARRVAATHGIKLGDLAGTGPLGRITRADVLAAAGIVLPVERPTPPPIPIATADPAPSPATGAGSRRRELTRTQQLIATRMVQSKSTIPHFQVQTEADMASALTLRDELKTLAVEGQAVPSLNDFIIKAAAVALRNHPLANASYKDDAFELHDSINIGVAVAANDTLAVPTIFDADTKSLGRIATETGRLAAGVRDQTITPADLEGGTFTVSNLGMFGMTAITPVINSPQAAILGVGAVRSSLARGDGQIIDRQLLTLTLSCDHRILYGADAARFLAEIKDLLQTPLRLAL